MICVARLSTSRNWLSYLRMQAGPSPRSTTGQNALITPYPIGKMASAWSSIWIGYTSGGTVSRPLILTALDALAI